MQGRSWAYKEVLVEATEINKMTQTKSVEKRGGQNRTRREGTYFHYMKEDI